MGYAFVHFEVMINGVVINLAHINGFFPKLVCDEGLYPYYLTARVKSRKALFIFVIFLSKSLWQIHQTAMLSFTLTFGKLVSLSILLKLMAHLSKAHL
jgi:hypothetical protein